MIQNGNQPRVGKPVTNSELAESIRAMVALLEADVIVTSGNFSRACFWHDRFS